ncbi:unnamed protein product [Phytophthora fragariaefolia]|uniref:Peroxisomal trans-2-enoyl-CoA reductase n=1 Tax=Phytophthora fragariaefolia TaxID=1490495 RepID=A0A9W6YH74_9STRA|nr:unnamed protein product [Phytophthora fragariaefolia]
MSNLMPPPSNFERLQEAADKIQADVKAANSTSEGSVHPIACNIRSEEQVSNLVDEILAKFKRVDFLVNNGKATSSSLRVDGVNVTTSVAGGQFRSLLEDVSLKGWQAVMNTNLGVENYPSGAEMFEYAAEKATAAKRMGSVEEVSAGVLYYLSPAGAYVTGDTMHVDGGWHLMGPLLDVPAHENNHPYGTSKL